VASSPKTSQPRSVLKGIWRSSPNCSFILGETEAQMAEGLVWWELPLCSLSHSWFHSLQTKPTIPYLSPLFLYQPLDFASSAGLVLCWSRLTVPYLPPPPFAWELASAAGLFLCKSKAVLCSCFPPNAT
jgi:hypothetical protein